MTPWKYYMPLTLSLPTIVHFWCSFLLGKKVKLTKIVAFENFIARKNCWEAGIQAGSLQHPISISSGKHFVNVFIWSPLGSERVSVLILWFSLTQPLWLGITIKPATSVLAPTNPTHTTNLLSRLASKMTVMVPEYACTVNSLPGLRPQMDPRWRAELSAVPLMCAGMPSYTCIASCWRTVCF